MLEILAHRGLWKSAPEQNSVRALAGALEAGFGVELDVRDCEGELVVSHDPPLAAALCFEELYQRAQEVGGHGRWAINIKADGLQNMLAPYLPELAGRAFMFDASLPDLLKYERQGWPVFTRYSEFEPVPAMLAAADGVWIDGFDREAYQFETFASWLATGKQLCFVSPELHGRAHRTAWGSLRDWLSASASTSVALCTDFPREAREYFG